MIHFAAYAVWLVVTGWIWVLVAVSFTAEWGASRLTVSQKFLRKILDGGRDG